MPKATYCDELIRHLGMYKSARLGIEEAGTFLHQGRLVRHPHILPKDQELLNILEPIRADVQKYLGVHSDVRLHKYFHHLNSSQAFAFNLFFPFFERGASASLLRSMGLTGEVRGWEPEFVLNEEEGTNADVVWTCDEVSRVYCEVKLTEREFGRATDDERHRRKREETYVPVLRRYCGPEALEPGYFFAHYQIFRNIWLAAQNETDSVVFLLPTANVDLWAPLYDVRSKLKAELAQRVHLVSMEQVLNNLAADGSLMAELSEYVEMLAEKYIPPISVPRAGIPQK